MIAGRQTDMLITIFYWGGVTSLLQSSSDHIIAAAGCYAFSALMLLVGRQEGLIRPVKNWSGEVLAWLSVWSEVRTCIWPS